MNVQELIGEVAKRHNVLVDPEDPVFVAVTLNELLLAEHVEKVQAALARAEKATEAASSQHLADAKCTVSMVIADSGKHIVDEIHAAGSRVRYTLQQVAKDYVSAAQAASAEATRQRRAGQRAAIVSIGFACLILGMAVATWFGHP